MLFFPIIKISIAKISRLKNHCISETSQKKVAAHISWFKEYDKYSWLLLVFYIINITPVLSCAGLRQIYFTTCVLDFF